MKTLFLTAATAALIIAAPTAFAADDHHGHPGGGGQHAEHAAPTHTEHAPAPTHTEHAPAHTGHTAAPAMTMSGGSHGHSHHGMTMTNSTTPTMGNNTPHTGHGHGGNNRHGNNHGDNHGNGGGIGAVLGIGGHGGVNVHINFNRRNVTASHHYRYHGGAYRGPSGYSYHRYSYGETFPSIYFARDYWIDDYSDYGLSSPPDGTVWVRYGDDAVLVDQNSGEILEVVYGQFD